MTIPESQLTTWSHQGAVVSAANTHNSIRTALAAYAWPAGVTYEPYLQGSYRNSTNIRGNSDVDVVVDVTSVFWSNLTPQEKAQLALGGADYDLPRFRLDVISALVNYYGGDLVDVSGKKSIKVLPDGGRLKADVVVCGTYCHYENMRVRAEGITFWSTSSAEQIVNYPKLHWDNGVAKNSDSQTQGWYRASTRMFKNCRDRIVADHHALQGRFPSYFIECLLYNVPDSCFGSSYQSTYEHVVNWLVQQFDNNQANEFVCQNRMQWLFGPYSFQWNTADAAEYSRQLVSLWNYWN